MSNGGGVEPRMGRVLDLLAGSVVAGSLGLWVVASSEEAVTSADALFMPALIQDVARSGLHALGGWHYGSSSFLVPDVFVFALGALFSTRFDTLIQFNAAAVTALTTLAVWTLFRTRRDASFAVFASTFALGLAVLTGLEYAFGGPRLLFDGWQRFAVLATHHYGTCINSLVSLAIFLWWRREPRLRRTLVLACLVFVGVVSDLLFLTIYPAVFVADYWVEGGSPLRWAARRWQAIVALVVPAAVAVGIDAALNPLSPLRTVPNHAGKTSALTALRIFLEVRFHSGPHRTTESVASLLLLLAIVVIALRARRRARLASDESATRIAIVMSFLFASTVLNLAAAIVTGKYLAAELDRYIQPLGFFPLCGAFGWLASIVAARVERTRLAPAAAGAVGLASVAGATAKTDFSSVAPYVRCIDELELAGTAGLAPYWRAKPLFMFADRRVQAVQITDDGYAYSNVTNDQWNAENWFGPGHEPDVRFALMATEARGKAILGRTPYVGDGTVLNPAIIRKAFGEPTDVRECRGALFWLYAPGVLAGKAPIARGGWIEYPLRIRADHVQLFRDPKASVAGQGRARTTGVPGVVQYGPFIAMTPGRYRVRWQGRFLAPGGRLNVDVAAGSATLPGSIRSAEPTHFDDTTRELVSSDFEIAKGAGEVEFRAYSEGGVLAELDEIIVERL